MPISPVLAYTRAMCALMLAYAPGWYFVLQDSGQSGSVLAGMGQRRCVCVCGCACVFVCTVAPALPCFARKVNQKIVRVAQHMHHVPTACVRGTDLSLARCALHCGHGKHATSHVCFHYAFVCVYVTCRGHPSVWDVNTAIFVCPDTRTP